jgi:hypothetical protein
MYIPLLEKVEQNVYSTFKKSGAKYIQLEIYFYKKFGYTFFKGIIYYD